MYDIRFKSRVYHIEHFHDFRGYENFLTYSGGCFSLI